MLDFVPLSGDTSIRAAHTSQGSRLCPGRRDWRLLPGPRPHTYPDNIRRDQRHLDISLTSLHPHTVTHAPSFSSGKTLFILNFVTFILTGRCDFVISWFPQLSVTSSVLFSVQCRLELDRVDTTSSQSSNANIEVLCLE